MKDELVSTMIDPREDGKAYCGESFRLADLEVRAGEGLVMEDELAVPI